MREITLTQGFVTLVDDADYEALLAYKWRLQRTKTTVLYATATNKAAAIRQGGPTNVILHRLLLNAPAGVLVDHINGDGLDNRRSNLRLASHAENHWNGTRRGGTSQYKGVSWRSDTKKWVACLMKHYKKINLGCYSDELEAAKAYNEGALYHFGKYARLNVL